MRKIILLTFVFASSFVFSQDQVKQLGNLTDALKKSKTAIQRDSILNEMDRVYQTVSGIEKPLAAKLISLSKDLSKRLNLYVPFRDPKILTKEDLRGFRMETDKFSGDTTIKTKLVYPGPCIDFRIKLTKNGMAVFFDTHYRDSDWIFMQNATLIIDGEKYRYSMSDPDREVGSYVVYEDSSDIADENMMNILSLISKSKNPIDVRFSGKYTKDFVLAERTKERATIILNIYNKLKL